MEEKEGGDGMRRVLMAAVLLLLALLLTAAALAEGPEGPMDPYMGEMLVNAGVPTKVLFRSLAASSGYSIQLMRQQAPSYTQTGKWYVSKVYDPDGAECDLGDFLFEFYFGENGSTYFGDAWPVYWQKKSASASFESCPIVAPDDYRMVVNVYHKDAPTQRICQRSVTFSMAEDEDHPSLETIAARIVAENRGATDFDTALNLYDWIMANTEYDKTYQYYGADGALLRGTGVCDSYSKAYYLLMRAAGIDCYRHVSTNTTGDKHSWNAICLDGQWYQVDATWDDSNGTLHEYFCITDALMLSSGHSYTPSTARVCDSLAMNYYMVRGGWEDWNIAFVDSLYDAVLDGRGGAGVRPTGETARHLTILSYILTHRPEVYADITDKTLAFAYNANIFSCAVMDEHAVSGEWVYTPLAEDGASVAGYLGVSAGPTIPSTLDGRAVTGIDACAFRNNTALTRLNVPDALTAVGERALDGCTRLTGLILPDGVSLIGEQALPADTVLSCGQDTALARALGTAGYSFRDPNLPVWLLQWQPGEPMTLAALEGETNAETLTVPDCVNALMSLNADSLRMLYAGPQLTRIGEDVAAPAGLLAVVTVSGSAVADWGAAQGVRVLCTDRQTVLPALLTEIGDEAYTQTALEWVIIPEGVTRIGAGAFAGCDSLAAVTLPAGDVQIDTSAFSGSPVLLLVQAGSPAQAWAQANGVPAFAE